MVAKPLYPLYKNIIKPLDRVRYPELRYPLYFSDICITEKRSGDDIRQTFLQYLECQVNLYRAVVAAHDVGMNLGFCNLFSQAVGYQEVVDAPAGILLACLEPV